MTLTLKRLEQPNSLTSSAFPAQRETPVGIKHHRRPGDIEDAGQEGHEDANDGGAREHGASCGRRTQEDKREVIIVNQTWGNGMEFPGVKTGHGHISLYQSKQEEME